MSCSRSSPLDPALIPRSRKAVGIALYLSIDRADIQYAVKCLSQDMSAPTTRGWERAQRLGRYLQGTRDVGTFPAAKGSLDTLTAMSDSDLAGDKRVGRSTLGGCLSAPGCAFYNFSRTQRAITPVLGRGRVLRRGHQL